MLAAVLLAVALTVAVGSFVGLRGLGEVLRPESTGAGFYTQRLVVVGVADRSDLTTVDTDLLSEYDAQVGAVLTGGGCPASGWATLSAGSEVTVSCQYEVTSLGVVDNWSDRQAEAARTAGELGSLASAGQECISAVGPGAALAAARPDGTTAEYLDVDGYVAGGYATACPVTLVDAGPRSDEVIRALAAEPDVTVIVTGIGGAADAQLIYRLGTTLPGWLISDSTGRTGVVTLPDLTRTLQSVIRGTPGTDSEALEVIENSGVPVDRLAGHVQQTDRLVSPVTGPALVLLAVALFGGLVGTILWWQARRTTADTPARRATDVAVPVMALLAATAPAALLSAGAVAWWRSGGPETSLVGATLVIWLVLAGLAGVSRRFAPLARRGFTGWPSIATLTYVIFLADAALGGYLHRGSLLAIRPMREFAGFDGPAMGILVGAGLAVAGLAAAPWATALANRAQGAGDVVDNSDAAVSGSAGGDDVRPRQLPFEILWRPLVVLAVLVSLVLGVTWAAHPMSAADVLGFGIALTAVLVAGWWLHRVQPASLAAERIAARDAEVAADEDVDDEDDVADVDDGDDEDWDEDQADPPRQP